MRNLTRRIERLEHGPGGSPQTAIQLIIMHAGAEFALDLDRCAAIVAECGFGYLSLLDFSHIPDGLNAKELESYLREHGRGTLSQKLSGTSVLTSGRL
jgi:hypothetical protein